MVDSVSTRRAFSALSRSRARGRSGPLWAVRADAPAGTPEACGAPVRVAYAVGRATGTAVVRNRLRRRLRAAVDEVVRGDRVAPGMYLIGARPDAADMPFAELRQHLAGALGGAR